MADDHDALLARAVPTATPDRRDDVPIPIKRRHHHMAALQPIGIDLDSVNGDVGRGDNPAERGDLLLHTCLCEAVTR